MDLLHRPARRGVPDHRRLEQGCQPAGVGRPGRFLVDDPVEPTDHVVAEVVRRAPLEDVEHRGPQRPHVGGLVATGTARDLGREVRRRPGDHAGLGEGRIRGDPGDAEVGELHLPGPVDQDVGRLDVAVHDPRGVCGGQGVGGLHEQRCRLVGGEGTAFAHQPPEVDPVDVLHHQPPGVVVDDRVEDRDHVRMVQPCAEPCLALGAGEVGPVGAREQPDPLERHGPVEDLVAAQPDRPGATATDLAVERVPSCDHACLPVEGLWAPSIVGSAATRADPHPLWLHGIRAA